MGKLLTPEELQDYGKKLGIWAKSANVKMLADAKKSIILKKKNQEIRAYAKELGIWAKNANEKMKKAAKSK